ncbi:hypothetical protein RHMOL_Rhmol13G0258400 [Rhododendron molle]|uniref:Uncharacterized protein n=1 Tax=Rhododendron molle TaxID=49168 RepID=A0ACC0LAZ5_RHOML|nr:hypothetical protein RHMOL_Rhmol13G0258400 [Rhododendron molle]
MSWSWDGYENHYQGDVISFRKILRTLQSIDNAGPYHERIEEAVRIDANNEVFIATSNYNEQDVTKGVLKDFP